MGVKENSSIMEERGVVYAGISIHPFLSALIRWYDFSTLLSFLQELSVIFWFCPSFFEKNGGQSLKCAPFSYSERGKGGGFVPKNTGKGGVRTALFVLLTAIILCGNGFYKKAPLHRGALYDFVNEVISWVAAIP